MKNNYNLRPALVKNLSASIKNLEDLQRLSKQTLLHKDLSKISKCDKNIPRHIDVGKYPWGSMQRNCYRNSRYLKTLKRFLKNLEGSQDLCRTILQAQPNSQHKVTDILEGTFLPGFDLLFERFNEKFPAVPMRL